MKWLALLASVVGLVGCGTTGKTPRQNAVSYVHHLGTEAHQVQANLQVVQIDIGSKGSIDQLAQDAQTAHDNLDQMRQDFALDAGDSGNLGDAETEVFAAANDLKNAMGALVAYTGNPNPATLAQFTSKYRHARGEWNQGVRAIWRIAHHKGTPTI